MDKPFKRYTLIDNLTGNRTHYGLFGWNISWSIVFLLGVIVGYLISKEWNTQ